MSYPDHVPAPVLSEVADHCIEARRALGSRGGSVLRLLLDMILLEVGKELAAAEKRQGTNGPSSHADGSDDG